MRSLTTSKVTCRVPAAVRNAPLLAEPEGYVRVFVDEGEPIQLLISYYELHIDKRKHGERHNAIEYAGKLLAAFAQPAALPPAGIDNPTPLRSGEIDKSRQ